MGYTCCVPNCNSGYRSAKNKEKIAVYRFPTDSNMLHRWINAIPRKNWNVTKFTRICAKHFSDDDFETASTDKCQSRQNKRGTQQLKRTRLKANAVPHIFPGLPKYLSKPVHFKRSTSACSSSARVDKENSHMQMQHEKMLENDCVRNFNELKNCNNFNLLSDVIKVEKEHSIQFHYICCSDGIDTVPSLMASIIIREDLSLDAFVNSVLLPKEMYKHLMTKDRVSTLTEISNVIAFCKNLGNDLKSQHTDNISCINLAISALKQFQNDHEIDESNSIPSMHLIKFIIEQLSLLQCSKHSRRYSSELITLAFLWKLNSSSLYNRLSDVFILPSTRRLQQLSIDLNVDTRKVDITYLKQRTSDLTVGERTVVLLIDEVYTAQRVEYSNGSYIGMTEDGHVAKTVLAFMVQSVCKNYRDIVCLVPVEKLDTKLLHSYFNIVMHALDEIFFVVAVSLDNHICNR